MLDISEISKSMDNHQKRQLIGAMCEIIAILESWRDEPGLHTLIINPLPVEYLEIQIPEGEVMIDIMQNMAQDLIREVQWTLDYTGDEESE